MQEYDLMLQANPSQPQSILTLLLSGLLSGVVGGVVVAVLNYFLTRRKTNAEIKKLQVEAEKFSLEAEKLRRELSSNAESIASASYQLSNAFERVIYESRNRDIGYDFKGMEGYRFEKDVRIEPKGTGKLTFENGILNLQRTNIDGRYEISLHAYNFGDGERESIPRDDLIAGKRRLRISFEAKVVGGKHTLKFVFKGQTTGKWLAQGETEIVDENWVPFTMYCLVSAKENSHFRIADQDLAQAPSSIQIRNLVLAEKVP